jgi:hypothetical protein
VTDNSTQTGADTIRDKDRAGVKTQIMGLDVGIGTSTEALMSSTNPMPTYTPDVTATGTITVTDSVVAAPGGAGAVVTGASTSGSLVAIQCPGGDSAWNLMIKSLTSGTLYFEGSLNSTTGTDGDWIAVQARQSGILSTNISYSATTNSVWRGNTSGLSWFRIRSVGALTGTPAITIRLSDGEGATFLNASLPTGTNTIGAITGTGTAGTPATGVQTVQGIASGTALPVSLATNTPTIAAGTATIGAVKPAPSATGTITSVGLSLTSVTILASNANRLGAFVYNDSGNILYLALASGTAASTTAYTVQVPPNSFYELPSGQAIYTGAITGIALVASGNARVTELT